MIKDKVAILTAAGTGMGADAAKKLVSDGFKISILSSSGKGEALAKELGGIGVTGSNQSNDDLKKIVDETNNKWGRIDVLVNSAGHGPRGPILELTDEDWHKGMDTYFMNVVRSTRLVTPIMQKQKSGVIINISTPEVGNTGSGSNVAKVDMLIITPDFCFCMMGVTNLVERTTFMKYVSIPLCQSSSVNSSIGPLGP